MFVFSIFRIFLIALYSFVYFSAFRICLSFVEWLNSFHVPTFIFVYIFFSFMIFCWHECFADAIPCRIDVRLIFDRLELAAERRICTSYSDPTGDCSGAPGCDSCCRRSAASRRSSCIDDDIALLESCWLLAFYRDHSRDGPMRPDISSRLEPTRPHRGAVGRQTFYTVPASKNAIIWETPFSTPLLLARY